MNDIYLTQVSTDIDINNDNRVELQVTEVNLTESLLIPGLQTNVIISAKITVPNSNGFVKGRDLNDFYNKNIRIRLDRPILAMRDSSGNSWGGYNVPSYMEVEQRVYRLSKRKRVNYDIETFEINACDPTQLEDAKRFVSSSWKCTTPSSIASEVLRNCAGATKLDIESSIYPRDYIAQNIHPFQVAFQQSEVAISSFGDPSFIHYMTFENFGTHHFRSLSYLGRQSPVFKFIYSDKGVFDLNYANPNEIMSYEFPCDFDLLSDLMNGYDENGVDITWSSHWNDLTAKVGAFGEGTFGGCGTTPYVAVTPTGTESDMDICNPNIEKYLVKRKPRMSLLDQDKIALKMIVPFSPFLHAGKIIEVVLPDKSSLTGESKLYGSGNYLICNMTHNIKAGGLGTTVLECVADTVAAGKQ